MVFIPPLTEYREDVSNGLESHVKFIVVKVSSSPEPFFFLSLFSFPSSTKTTVVSVLCHDFCVVSASSSLSDFFLLLLLLTPPTYFLYFHLTPAPRTTSKRWELEVGGGLSTPVSFGISYSLSLSLSSWFLFLGGKQLAKLGGLNVHRDEEEEEALTYP